MLRIFTAELHKPPNGADLSEAHSGPPCLNWPFIIRERKRAVTASRVGFLKVVKNELCILLHDA
uniref:Uncharacterized protein n=1 Tax=Anguilla anguilla TaxID=7936 RepID=A0A0E9SJA5_ANGAN